MVYAMNLVLLFLEGLCLNYFLSLFYPVKYGKKTLFFGAGWFALGWLICGAALQEILPSALMQLFAAVLLSLGAVFLFYKGAFLHRLFIYLLGVGLAVFSRGVTAAVFAVFGVGGMTEKFLQGDAVGLMMFQCIHCAFFIFFLVFLVMAILIWKKEILFSDIKLFLFFPPAQLIIILVPTLIILRAQQENIYVFTTVAVIGCLAANIFAYREIMSIGKKTRAEEQAKFFEEQLQTQMKHYEAFSDYSEKLKQLQNDLKARSEQIQKLLREKEYSQAGKMMEDLSQEVDDLRKVSFCEHKLVNALLYMVYKDCGEAGIQCRFEAGVPEKIDLDSSDLCRLFSNILENAKEACANCDEKWIHLRSASVADYFLIKCENSRTGELKKDRQQNLLSTKGEPGHGQGMKSMQEIVRKYEGDLSWEAESDVFSITLRLHVDHRKKLDQRTVGIV